MKIILIILILVNLAGCSTETENSINEQSDVKKNEGVNVPSEQQNKKLSMAVVPSSNAIDLQTVLKPLVNYLHTKLDSVVILKFATNYEHIVDKLGTEYDFALMGAYSYVESHKKNQTLPLVKSIRNGKASYKGIIITHKDSGIKSIADIKNKKKIKAVFTDRYSTSGFLYPAADIIKSGIDINKDLEFKFVKGHDNVVKIISAKGADIGACYQGAVEKYLTKEKSANIVIIKETDEIPGDPLVIGKNIIENKELKEKMLEALVSLKEPAILNSLAGGLEGYAVAADSDYDNLREKINLINQYFK
ncbi:phosphate/phosphite/phosphonate ABC transporter substrate-binding protein [Candidatus Dependentiae bacterium]|nr:phosphate/phosphite/phosphonate ABC transporter substrate-binding protein [Candidatus Dependentiae bacterium]